MQLNKTNFWLYFHISTLGNGTRKAIPVLNTLFRLILISYDIISWHDMLKSINTVMNRIWSSNFEGMQLLQLCALSFDEPYFYL